MEYGELGHLCQLLEEDFIEFLCRSYIHAEKHVQAIQVNVGDVLKKLNAPASTSEPTIPEKLPFFFNGLTNIRVSDNAAGARRLQRRWSVDHPYKMPEYNRDIFNRRISIVHKLDEALASLEIYLDQDPGSSSHSSALFEGYSRREFADYLLSLIKKHRELVCLLNSLAEEAIALHDTLGSLLLQLKVSNDHPANESIHYDLLCVGEQLDHFMEDRDDKFFKVDVECLETAKCRIDDCRNVVYQFVRRSSTELERKKIVTDLNDVTASTVDQLPLPPPKSKLSSVTVAGMHLLHSFPDLSGLGAKNEADGNHGTRHENFPSSSSFMNQSLPKVHKDCFEVSKIIFGLDSDELHIIDLLTRQQVKKLSIVTIGGMGGIGKTTLAKRVYNHQALVYKFQYTAWLSGITSADQVLSHLFHSINSTSDVVQRANSDSDKVENLWKSLRGKPYLIVLDDLQNLDAWEAISKYFPDDQVGSRILITSRSMEFPDPIPKEPAHCMKLLNDFESWEMLQRLVFGDRCCPSELVATGKMIIEKCGGLRITIVVIAGILLSIPRSCDSWRSVMDSVQSIVSDNPELDILALSFKYLPLHLKSCFLYMGHYPSNYEFDAEKLFDLWLAEGYLYSTAPNLPETEAQRYLEDLIHRCLVMAGERGFDGKIKTCSIHELLRQLCIRENEDTKPFNGRTGSDQRQLILNETNENGLPELSSYRCLRSFTMLSGSAGIGSFPVFRMSSYGWRRLKVLDLYCLSFETLPSDIQRLLNLRYLAINVASVLDNSFSAFWKLQTLVIYGPWVSSKVDLPIFFLDFWRMPLLRSVTVRVPSYLNFYHAPEELPDCEPVPCNLHTLQTVTFSCCKNETFHLLSKLKKLGVCENKDDYESGAYRTCFETLLLLTELEILKCFFSKFRMNMSNNFSLDALPSNLKRLTLCGSCLPWDNMKLLASLPKLETLKLKDHAFRGEKWELTGVVFECLKHMLIEESDLELWEAESDDHFPCLERLVLRSCRCLLSVPFEAFSTLQLIDLYKCNESAVASAKENEKDYGKPEVTETKKKKVVEKDGKSIIYEQ